MHGGIQVDSALSDAERRAKLYEGDIFLYSPIRRRWLD
jgi:hypothetical protein